MSSVPPVHTWVNGERPNFRQMNDYVTDVLNFMFNPPMLRLRRTTAQSIPNNASTAISWNFVELENYNFWDAAQPTKITPSVPGWYVGSAGYSFAANAAGYREMNVIKNASGTERVLRMGGDGYFGGTLTTGQRGQVFLEQFNGTTDFMTVELFQNSGGALSTLTSGVQDFPDVVLRWLAPL